MEQTQSFICATNLGVKTVQGAVFEDVSFTANRGEVIALLGAEGCGKTSLLLTLGGRMKPTAGDAVIAGHSLTKDYKYARDISGISLIKNVNDVPEYLLVHEILAADLALHGQKSNKAAVAAYLEEWGFTPHKNKRISDLNPNEKAEFDLMMACTNHPTLLLLDGVGSGMTHRRTAQLVEHLGILARWKNICIIFSTHEYDIAEKSDGAVVLSRAAEEARLRIIGEVGSSAICPIAGSGNGVVCTEYLTPPGARGVQQSTQGTYPAHLADLFTESALSATANKEAN